MYTDFCFLSYFPFYIFFFFIKIYIPIFALYLLGKQSAVWKGRRKMRKKRIRDFWHNKWLWMYRKIWWWYAVVPLKLAKREPQAVFSHLPTRNIIAIVAFILYFLLSFFTLIASFLLALFVMPLPYSPMNKENRN